MDSTNYLAEIFLKKKLIKYENIKNILLKKYFLYKNKYINLKQLRGGNNNIKILSYNVSWESMIGHRDDCGDCKKNIIKVFNDNICDFFLIQEASNFDDVEFKDMTKLYHKSGPEDSIIYYNNSYKLISHINGEFEVGRPYIIASFEKDGNNIIIINVHLPNDSPKYFKIITQSMIDEFKSIIQPPYPTDDIIKNFLVKIKQIKMIEKDLQHIDRSTKIIIGGDFNFDFIPNYPIQISDINFTKEKESLNTCCDFFVEGDISMIINKLDHFLITDNLQFLDFNYATTIKPKHSDHLPIVATIKL